ncbi:hypothetical protein ACIOC1_00250 [Streptomyces sp. NPDC088197]|uniref:hypothetical protein n=1 Tax=Streptomyces sp. NPDC088197 TaxID=3365840 RepID=UPI0037F33FA9
MAALWVAGAVVLLFFAMGLDDRRQRREQARAELERARRRHPSVAAGAVDEAHRHLLSSIPRPRSGENR